MVGIYLSVEAVALHFGVIKQLSAGGDPCFKIISVLRYYRSGFICTVHYLSANVTGIALILHPCHPRLTAVEVAEKTSEDLTCTGRLIIHVIFLQTC